MSKPSAARRKRRSLTSEFKTEAARLVIDVGRSIPDVAKELDLTQSALRSWVSQARTDAGNGPPGALTTDEREELQRLRRETRQLKMEREILKKAAAFFAKEST
jgi:transposase-like protein